jgi:succinate-acetate transporter protein
MPWFSCITVDERPTARFWIGCILLIVNTPFGWGAAALCASVAVVTACNTFYTAGVVAYGLSWLMLATGLLLSGPEGVRFSRMAMRRFIRRVMPGSK